MKGGETNRKTIKISKDENSDLSCVLLFILLHSHAFGSMTSKLRQLPSTSIDLLMS